MKKKKGERFNLRYKIASSYNGDGEFYSGSYMKKGLYFTLKVGRNDHSNSNCFYRMM